MIGEMLTCSVIPFQCAVSSAAGCSCVLLRPRRIENHLTNVFAGISEHCRKPSFRRFYDAHSSHFKISCMAGCRKFDDIKESLSTNYKEEVLTLTAKITTKGITKRFYTYLRR